VTSFYKVLYIGFDVRSVSRLVELLLFSSGPTVGVFVCIKSYSIYFLNRILTSLQLSLK
jgi:hypothetical protein